MTWNQFFQSMRYGAAAQMINRGGRRGGQQAATKGARPASTKAPVVASEPKQQEKPNFDSWDFLVLDEFQEPMILPPF